MHPRSSLSRCKGHAKIAACMGRSLFVEPVGKLGCHIRRSGVAEQPWRLIDWKTIQAERLQRQVEWRGHVRPPICPTGGHAWK
jgi:hypothetical protein